MTPTTSRRSALASIAALGLAPLAAASTLARPRRRKVDDLATRYDRAATRAADAWRVHEALYGELAGTAPPSIHMLADRSCNRADRLTAAREGLGRELAAAILGLGLLAVRVGASLYVAAPSEGEGPEDAELRVVPGTATSHCGARWWSRTTAG